MSDRKKLILIDGNSITYRAFFALPLLSTASGRHTNAAYGFTMMLLRLLQDEQPTHVAVAFDKGKTTFRTDMYAEYKGTREKTPGELSEQFPIVREVLDAFGIPHIEREGFEADDIIGTLTRQAEKEGYETLVVSGDKDLLQLVSGHVHAILTRKGITETERYDIAKIQERYGLTPEQIIDLKGLMGDTSDNIPGIPGVGEKTALKLLHEFGSVEQVLANADKVPGKKLQEKLQEHKEDALLSKKLATIFREVPLDVAITQFAYEGFDTNRVRETFKQYEFKSLLNKLPEDDGTGAGESSSAEMELPVKIIGTGELDKLLGDLPVTLGLQIDFEGSYQQASIRGVALGTADQAWYIPVDNGSLPSGVKALFSNPDKLKVLFDVKSAVYMLRDKGVELDRNTFDVLLAGYLLNPQDGTPKLEDIISRELNWSIPGFRKADKKTGEPALEERADFYGKTASALFHLQPKLIGEMERQEVDSLYQDLELPLTYVLADMEYQGVKVDTDRLHAIGAELAEKIDRLTKEIYELAGTEFNINSPKQLGEILFDKMGLPTQKKTKTGYSTSAEVLEKLAPYSEIVQKILEFRQLGKLQSTYVEGLLKVVREDTGKVHTSFNQATTATGRLSSTEPNLQNIPIRMEEGRRLRHAFVPSEAGWKILAADYSQIELRILAHISGDSSLIDAFVNDMDIHTRTASDVFEVPIDQVTSDMRRAAKAVNFGIVYGISDYGLSQNLNITRKQAAEFIENYFAKFPGVKKYMDEVVVQARKDGYVTTLLNRRRYLPDLHSSNYNIRSFAERAAQNTRVQGSAADIIKLAMNRIAAELKERGLKSRMLLQVHDELVFEVPGEELDIMKELVPEVMENAIKLDVPLKADVAYGDTWYDAK
ncbi:DNA polymerase I [Effusibacillus lacus]|uniref:DNA polymerase I n=1 Tax=Effusibacillus lacus TaxID=1348429 RepID=A0A292YLW9_9BACL|nr:DNA polymerase I [Effusibacillus lacus]TCS73613.1 DNA polymerase I [Effusibacillus lacus]GAX89495.1 DNA polymerase I [Effusibacillus lacus]